MRLGIPWSRVLQLLFLLLLPGLTRAQGPQVTIDSGIVEGSVADGVAAFKGIPYAQPPLKELRWRAPQPVKPWEGVRAATKYGPDCLQNGLNGGPTWSIPPLSEDCLYINVLEPAERPAGGKLPVMVWIYGGGSVIGGTTVPVYQGNAFAKQGVIFVSLNYRLGRMGYFAHPALTAENADGMLGNYGYMDQIAALKWVQRNIAAFGGDAGNVTVFGESHGGRSIQMLLGTSLAKGLFQRVIIESGFGRMYQPPLSVSIGKGPTSAEEVGLKFANSIGVTGTDEKALEELRAMPADKIIGKVAFSSGREDYAGPMIDGKLVPADSPDIYLSGDGQPVPLLIGTNDEDTGTAAGKTADEILNSFGPYRAEAEAAYQADSSSDVAKLAALVGRDRVEIEPARFVARIYASMGMPVYEYRFSYVATDRRSAWTGAHHASEIPYVFDTVRARTGDKTSQQDEKVAHLMLRYWVNFAKTGDPNGEGLPAWPRYSPQRDVLLNFTSDALAVTMPDPFKARLDAVAAAASAVATPAAR